MERVPANVKGDGKSTIKELILKKNEERKGSSILKKLKMGKETKRNLKQQGYSLKSVPRKEEVVFLRTNANISDGADSYEVQNQINDTVKETIVKAVRSIPGLRVAGVDVLIDKDDFHIIEINGNPMVSIHYETSCGQSKEVGKDVIKAMFPEL